VSNVLTIPEDLHLTEQIRQTAKRGTLGHALILSGRGDTIRAARFAAAAMECESSAPPCGTCPSCQKVLRDIHPDVITVVDTEHKNISVDVLRQVRADAYVLPNEGRRKIYIFPDCDLLEPKAQNVLLKVLEEGPAHAAFIFCAQNSAVLLQTIRSRCVEWKISSLHQAPVGSDEGARQLCQLLCQGKRADLIAFCTQLENSKITREQLQTLLSDTRDLLSGGLAACYGTEDSDPLFRQLAQDMGRQKLSAAADIFQEFTRQCGYNIGVGHLTGALAVALTEK